MGHDISWTAASEFLRNPLMVGSAFPATKRMVAHMLDPLDWPNIRLLVEYVPGTGCFTFEALRRLGPDATLIAIEAGRGFVEALRAHNSDPRLFIVEDAARHVRRFLAAHGHDRADCILTGLPFSTLTPGDAVKLMRETARALEPAGTLPAYQMRSAIRPLLERNFASVEKGYEWFNIPPCHLYRARQSIADGGDRDAG